MRVETALNAVRALGVDVANLTMRTALFQAASEELLEVVTHLDVTQWQDVTFGEGTEARMVTVIPLEQREFLEHLLDGVDGLR
jgi:hypothetical protein